MILAFFSFVLYTMVLSLFQFSILETGSPEEQFRRDALEVLSDTFETLNTAVPPNEARHQFLQLPLNVALKRAIDSYDLRSQLDIYDKLVEVSFPIPGNVFCCLHLT